MAQELADMFHVLFGIYDADEYNMEKNFTPITGSMVAIVTPFNADGSVDHGRLTEPVNRHIEKGTDAIVALGTTGETSSATLEEDIKTLDTVLKAANGRIPVVAGSGSNSSYTQKSNCEIFTKMGADAMLCISPYYIKINEEGMYRHFMMSAESDSAPIILYNVPGRTGYKISSNVVRRLSTHPNVMGIKEAMNLMGMNAGHYRMPLYPMAEGNHTKLMEIMKAAGLL